MAPPLGPLEALELGAPGAKWDTEWIFHPQSSQRLLIVVAVPKTLGACVPWGS